MPTIIQISIIAVFGLMMAVVLWPAPKPKKFRVGPKGMMTAEMAAHEAAKKRDRDPVARKKRLEELATSNRPYSGAAKTLLGWDVVDKY